MKLPKDPKAAAIYLENFNQLGEAIMHSGGNPFMVLKRHDEFMRILAENKIRVTAKYDFPDEVKKEEPTYYVDPKTLITKSKQYEKSYEEKEAEAIDEECRMTEEDYDEIDWDQWMKENPTERIPAKRRLNKNDKSTSVVRLSDRKVFTKNDNNQLFYHIDKETLLEEKYTFEQIQNRIDQGLFAVLKYSEESKKEKPKEFEVYPYEDKPKYFLEIYNGEQWKLCLRNDFPFSVPKFGWSSPDLYFSEGHPYTLGEGKIAHESMIDMYTLTNLKRIVDGLNLLHTKDTETLTKDTFETYKEEIVWPKTCPSTSTTSP